MFAWDVEENITVMLWFRLGDLHGSFPTSSALSFEHGQPDFSFPLSLPIFKGIIKKFEETIFSQAWKPLFFFHSILYIYIYILFRPDSWGAALILFPLFLLLIVAPLKCSLTLTSNVLLVPSPLQRDSCLGTDLCCYLQFHAQTVFKCIFYLAGAGIGNSLFSAAGKMVEQRTSYSKKEKHLKRIPMS